MRPGLLVVCALGLLAPRRVFYNPWMRQPQPGGPLELTAGGVSRRNDFAHWTVDGSLR